MLEMQQGIAERIPILARIDPTRKQKRRLTSIARTGLTWSIRASAA
jgi:hypothetical protein